MRKWTKTILLLVTVVMAMSLTCVTAFAAESDVIDETFTGVAKSVNSRGELVLEKDNREFVLTMGDIL